MDLLKVVEGGIEFECDLEVESFNGVDTIILTKVYVKGVDITEVIDSDWWLAIKDNFVTKLKKEYVAEKQATDLEDNEAYGI